MKRAGAGFDLFDWARRHPFLFGSLALHALLAVGLWLAGPRAVVQAQRAQDLARVDATVRAAQRDQVQRHLKRLEELGKEAGAQLPATAASSPVERATELTQRLEQAERKARTQELARLLKITPEEAAAKVRLEEAKRARPLPRDAGQAMAQLERRARDAVERQRAREQREREGRRVAGLPGAALAMGSGPGEGGAGRGSERGGGRWLGNAGSDRRHYDAPIQPPALDDVANLRFAVARRFGPGGPYANRVYLDRWYVAGPFPAANARAINVVQPPEIAIDLDGIYAGKHGLVRWQYQQSATYPFVPEPWDDEAIYYATTELHVDRDMEVWLDIGADDDTKLWLNDELVWFSGNGDKPWYHQAFNQLDAEMARYGFVESRMRVSLRAGRNTLLLKLYNARSLMFFSVVIAGP